MNGHRDRVTLGRDVFSALEPRAHLINQARILEIIGSGDVTDVHGPGSCPTDLETPDALHAEDLIAKAKPRRGAPDQIDVLRDHDPRTARHILQHNGLNFAIRRRGSALDLHGAGPFRLPWKKAERAPAQRERTDNQSKE
jgi:hypothetical protein